VGHTETANQRVIDVGWSDKGDEREIFLIPFDPGPRNAARDIELERRVDGAEHEAIWARWEFGRELLAEREANGGKQLPHGRLDEVCTATGKSRSEIQYRVQFAERYPTREKVSNALDTRERVVHPSEVHRGSAAGAGRYRPGPGIERPRQPDR
jgi:hypothetical protein